MDSFFDLIFSNIVPIIVVLAGILKFMSAKKENESKNDRHKKHVPTQRPGPGSPAHRRNQHGPATVPKPPSTTPSGTSKTASKPAYEKQTSASASSSFEDQQKKQMERLAGRMNTIEAIKNMEDMDNHHQVLQGLEHSNESAIKRKKAFRKQMGRQLTRGGLIEGIIMSEVLGAPRARKPYKSVVARRQER